MGNKLWRTPRDFFDAQHARYSFNVDAAANEENALVTPHDHHKRVERHRPCIGVLEGEWCGYCHNHIGRFYTEETDGRLSGHYQPGDRVFCNPPYDSSIRHWLHTARETSRDIEDVLWYLLLPPATETSWFHSYVWDHRFSRPREGVEMILPPGRIKFDDPTNGKRLHPRAGNLIVIFHPREVAD